MNVCQHCVGFLRAIPDESIEFIQVPDRHFVAEKPVVSHDSRTVRGNRIRAENQSRLRQQCFNRHQNLKVSLTQCYQLIQQGIGIGRFSVHVSHEQIIATHGQRNQIALISELLSHFGGQQKRDHG